MHAVFVVAAMLGGPVAYAVQPEEIMADRPRKRGHATCRASCAAWFPDQSIDDSDAPLARELRLLVRERIASGDSDGQVIDFLVARYGEFVLLKPRLTPRTLLLWLLPPLALSVAGWRCGSSAGASRNDPAPPIRPCSD